jgi:hypothetical protein
MAIPSTPIPMLREILYDFRLRRGTQVNENLAAASKSNFDPIVALRYRLITTRDSSRTGSGPLDSGPFAFSARR